MLAFCLYCHIPRGYYKQGRLFGVREYSVAQSDDEDVRELQTLALMDSHEPDLVRLLSVVCVGVEGDVLKIVVERKLLPLSVFTLVKPYGINQFRDVF